MKHIECPIKISLNNVKFPIQAMLNFQKGRNQVLCQIYGHFIFGFTQQSPKDYYTKYGIQVEGRLINRIQEWAEYMRYQNLPKVKMNIEEKNDNSIISYFFPDDDNIGWIYDDKNISLKITDSKVFKGVCIDRSKNLPKKDYTLFELKQNYEYKCSAKHIAEPPPSESFLQYKVEFITNRFLQYEGATQDGFRSHTLQIETLTGSRWIEKKSHYHITDVDNCLEDINHSHHCGVQTSLNQKLKHVPNSITKDQFFQRLDKILELSIYTNPKAARLRSVTKLPTAQDLSVEKIKFLKGGKKYSQKLTILEMLLKEVDEEVEQDMKDNPKCVKTPLQLQPLNDNFIEQLKHLKQSLQRVLRKKF